MGKVRKPTDLGVARPSGQGNVMGPSKRKQPFASFAQDLASREAAFRAGAFDTVNMQQPLEQIGAMTDAPAPLNVMEIPAARGLANMYAVAKEGSTQRETSGTAQNKALTAYRKSYGAYLRWRYPSRYKTKGSGTSNPYRPGQTAAGGYQVPTLPGVAPIPRYGEEQGS